MFWAIHYAGLLLLKWRKLPLPLVWKSQVQITQHTLQNTPPARVRLQGSLSSCSLPAALALSSEDLFLPEACDAVPSILMLDFSGNKYKYCVKKRTSKWQAQNLSVWKSGREWYK